MIAVMEKLRAWLLESETTQLAFAKALGVSQPTVSDWLTGNTTPTTQNLRAIAAHTGLSFEDLLSPTPSVPATRSHAAA